HEPALARVHRREGLRPARLPRGARPIPRPAPGPRLVGVARPRVAGPPAVPPPGPPPLPGAGPPRAPPLAASPPPLAAFLARRPADSVDLDRRRGIVAIDQRLGGAVGQVGQGGHEPRLALGELRDPASADGDDDLAVVALRLRGDHVAHLHALEDADNELAYRTEPARCERLDGGCRCRRLLAWRAPPVPRPPPPPPPPPPGSGARPPRPP